MLLYFPLSPSSTIHILLHFNSDFLAMNYESSIDRKKKDLLQNFLLFDMYLSCSCKHVGIIVVGLFWLNFVKSLSLFFLINLRIANWVYWDVLFFSFGSNWAFYQVKKDYKKSGLFDLERLLQSYQRSLKDLDQSWTSGIIRS